MAKRKPSPLIFGLGLVGAAFFFALAPFAVKLLWAWIVPDLLPGAVEQGLVAGSLSWWASLKVLVLLALLGVLFRSGGRK